MKKSSSQTKSCCENKTKIEGKGIWSGIIYGVTPHIGCIAFIVFSVLGVTTATALFKPLLLNPYFFYILVALSIVFATISALFYLKRHGVFVYNKTSEGTAITFSKEGIKNKWKYLSVLYGTTVGVNLLLFMIIFPLLANVSFPSAGSLVAAAETGSTNGISSLSLKVDIPCSGHAPLISQELKSIVGVTDVQFSFPNIFNVKYDSTKTSKQQILSLDVFNTYKATLIDESKQSGGIQTTNTDKIAANGGGCGCGSGCGASGGCGCRAS